MSDKIKAALSVLLKGEWHIDEVCEAAAAIDLLATHIAAQDAEIARLREALEFYATPASYACYETYDGNGYTASAVDKDNGDLARAALESQP